MANATTKHAGRIKDTPREKATFEKLKANLAKLPKDLKLK